MVHPHKFQFYHAINDYLHHFNSRILYLHTIFNLFHFHFQFLLFYFIFQKCSEKYI